MGVLKVQNRRPDLFCSLFLSRNKIQESFQDKGPTMRPHKVLHSSLVQTQSTCQLHPSWPDQSRYPKFLSERQRLCFPSCSFSAESEQGVPTKSLAFLVTSLLPQGNLLVISWLDCETLLATTLFYFPIKIFWNYLFCAVPYLTVNGIFWYFYRSLNTSISSQH